MTSEAQKESWRRATDTYQKKNPSRKKQIYSNWAKRNPDYFVTRNFGAGAVEHYKEQQKLQKGLCAICQKPLPARIHRDHNHETGKWRGVLCPGCNLGISPIERAGWLEKALAYLAFWKG